MKTKIILDSTTDILPSLKETVSVVPLTLRFGEEEYIDGIDIDRKTFYQKLIQSSLLPTTSQATPDAFIKEFEKVKQENGSAVVITISSKFSGTYQSAVIAAENYENIYVVDSGSAAIGGGILTETAVKLANEGLDAKSIAETLEQEKKKIAIVALVDTLEYLKKGGRISKTVAFAGTVLNIKPVLQVVDGEISMIGKARGSKTGNKLLAEQIEKFGIDFSKPVLLGYSGLDDTPTKNFIEESKTLWLKGNTTPNYVNLGSVIGTHAGPGAVAVAFFKK